MNIFLVIFTLGLVSVSHETTPSNLGVNSNPTTIPTQNVLRKRNAFVNNNLTFGGSGVRNNFPGLSVVANNALQIALQRKHSNVAVNAFDKGNDDSNRQPSHEQQFEEIKKELRKEKEELSQFVNGNSYDVLDKYLKQVKRTLRIFISFWDQDSDLLYLKNIMLFRHLIKQVAFQSLKRVENVIDFVTAKQSVDTENKEDYKTIQLELTEAEANVEFMGIEIQRFIDLVVNAADNEQLIRNAFNDLRSHAEAKPFLDQVQNAIKINQIIKLGLNVVAKNSLQRKHSNSAVDAIDSSNYDEYFNHQPSAEQQYEMIEKELKEEKEELFQFVNGNSYEGFDKYLDKVKSTLESFNLYFAEDTKLNFKNFIFRRDLIKQEVFQLSKRVQNVIDFVTAKQSVDTENKDNYKTIQLELTAAKANLEFMGKQFQDFIDLVNAANNEQLIRNAFNELRLQAEAKPFLVQVQKAININQIIKLNNDFRSE